MCLLINIHLITQEQLFRSPKFSFCTLSYELQLFWPPWSSSYVSLIQGYDGLQIGSRVCLSQNLFTWLYY